MKKYKIIFLLLLVCFTSCNYTDNNKKEILINNCESLEKINDNTFVVENLEGYYDKISIVFHSDSSYTMVCWGDRDSYLWNFMRDDVITVDIPYNRYKGINVEQDIKLISIIK